MKGVPTVRDSRIPKWATYFKVYDWYAIDNHDGYTYAVFPQQVGFYRDEFGPDPKVKCPHCRIDNCLDVKRVKEMGARKWMAECRGCGVRFHANGLQYRAVRYFIVCEDPVGEHARTTGRGHASLRLLWPHDPVCDPQPAGTEASCGAG